MGFAKVSKVLRFVFLGLFIFLLLTLIPAILCMIDPSIGHELGIYKDGINEDNFIAAYIPSMVFAVAALVMTFVCFGAYSRAKVKIRKERQETYESKWSGRRRFKLFARIVGIVLLAFGVLLSIGNKLYGAILIVVGLPFLILSFVIRVRKHAESRHTNRIVEGNTITINYNNNTNMTGALKDIAKIIQDAFNDGYYVLEKLIDSDNAKNVKLVFSTPLSNKEIQQQYQRREKYYLSRGKNANEMPWYFSEEVTIKHKALSNKQNGTHKTKVPVWNYEIRKTWEIEKDAYGHETSRKVVKEEKVKTTISHYEIVTYEDYATIYQFIDKDGKDLTMANGNVANIVHTYSIEVSREKVAK